MNLTKNFTLAELVYSDTAKARGIDNSLPPYLMRNAQALAERLQLIRDTLEVSITISSGYRCRHNNKLQRYCMNFINCIFFNKQHCFYAFQKDVDLPKEYKNSFDKRYD